MPKINLTFSEQELNNEQWRPVIGLESTHEVSNLGRLRVTRQYKNQWKAGHLCQPYTNQRGYAVFHVTVEGQRFVRRVHQIVALAFIGPCLEGMEVNHKDANKLNNRVDNLEYVTHLENIRHARRLKLYPSVNGSANPRATLNEAEVLAIRILLRRGSLVHEELAKILHVSVSVIDDIASNRSWRQVVPDEILRVLLRA